jgi:pimeloyl-ACP methyl ester carboxylesterase
MWPQSYETELGKAWARVRGVPSLTLQTSVAKLEYSTAGNGQPVLMSHGVMGGHPEGLGMVNTYNGDAFAIAPSRFGYFGSELPREATPGLQADVYAELLNHLEIDRAVVFGFSAGGPSTIEFALRHSDRVELLVLASSALPRRPIPGIAKRIGAPLMRLILRSNFPFWLFKTAMPGTFRHLLGVPKRYELSLSEQAAFQEVAESVFPIIPRREGAVFDTFIGNPHVSGCPLEEITAPTLIVHAADDALAPYETAVAAATRMRSARFVTIKAGGHEFLGHEAQVRDAVCTYLQELRERRKTLA